MKYNWTCPTNKLIDVLLKHGFKKIAFDENDIDFGTYYFAKTNSVDELNKSNIIIVKRHQIFTFIETPPEFPKDEFEKIHNEVSTKSAFAEHWAILLQNEKTKEYKFIQLQPMFVFGIIAYLGAFDNTNFIKNLKLKDSLSNKEKYNKFLKYLIDKKFKTTTEVVSDFDINDYDSIGYQIELHYGKDWKYIGPEIEFSAPENEERERYSKRDKVLAKAKEIFGHDVSDLEKQITNDFKTNNSYRLYKDLVAFEYKQKQKNKDITRQKAMEQFEKEIGFTIPQSVVEFYMGIDELLKEEKKVICPHCKKVIPQDLDKCPNCKKLLKLKVKKEAK